MKYFFRTFSIIGLIVSIAGLIFAGILAFFNGGMDGSIVVSIMAFGLGLIASIYGLILDYSERKAERVKEQYAEKVEQVISRPDAEDKKNDNPKEEESDSQKKQKLNALEYMGLNLGNINDYYTWSQDQAKSAFRFAKWMCAIGLVFLCGAVLIAIFYKSESSVPAAVITAVGGVVTELIAGTALVVYRKSLAQLNHYHKALHEDQRFLSSVNLLDRFSTTALQDQMLQEIIRSEIQMNIAEAGWEEDEKSDKKKEEKKDDGGSH